jgi:alkylation response protein AidB-like acyl-CoA dehydrogenase
VDIVEAIRALRPRIEAAADDIERLGTLPDDLYDALVATGYLRMTVPKRLGGAELTLAETNAVITEAARADGSVGWLAMIAMHVPVILSLLPQHSFDELFEDGPDLRARVVLAPRGRAVPVEGGYIVSGRWPFASGGPSPRVVAGSCIVEATEVPEGSEPGPPRMLIAVLPAADAEMLDTWNVMGLKGTNSCDFVVTDTFVPAARVAEVFTGTSCLDGPLSRIPFRLAVSPGHVAVAIGIARGAQDELAKIAAEKRSLMNPSARLGADPLFLQALGDLSMHVNAADALLEQATGRIWSAACEMTPLDRLGTLQASGIGPYGTGLCVRAVDAAYTLAGSASLYSTSPLQRRLRDIHVATQHAGVSTAAYQALGAALVEGS